MRGSFPRTFARPPPLDSSNIRKTPPLDSSNIRKTLKHVVKDQVVKTTSSRSGDPVDKIDRKPKPKIKTKPFLIGKELKTKDLRQTAADRASGRGTKT